LSVYEEILRKQDIVAEILVEYQSDIETLYLLLQKMNFRVSDRIFNTVFKTENIQ